jgi:hydrogenase maturation protease
MRDPSSPKTVRVLACGERLRGDDAVGPLAAELLPAQVRSLADVLEIGQMTVESLIDVPEEVALIVVDAAVGVAVGQVVLLPLADVARRRLGAAPASSHSLPPDQVVALAEEMRRSSLRGTFVGIGGAEFGFGEGLSPAVEAALPDLVAALSGEIRRLAAG